MGAKSRSASLRRLFLPDVVIQWLIVKVLDSLYSWIKVRTTSWFEDRFSRNSFIAYDLILNLIDREDVSLLPRGHSTSFITVSHWKYRPGATVRKFSGRPDSTGEVYLGYWDQIGTVPGYSGD